MSAALVDRDDRALGAAHDAQRPVEVALAQGRQLVVEEGQRVGRPAVGVMLPVHDDLAGVALAGRGEGGLELAEAEAMGDGRSDVQPGLEHDGHLVPGLVHLAAVDAAQGQLT